MIHSFREGLFIMNDKQDEIHYINSSAENIFNGGMMLESTSKVTAHHYQSDKKFKLVDFEDHQGMEMEGDDGGASQYSQFTAMQRRHMNRVETVAAVNDRLTMSQVIGLMESIPDKQTSFSSSAIYKVCLPKNRLATLWRARGSKASILKMDKVKALSQITHVMFEAQIIDFRGDKAIAIYLRDMTHFVRARKLARKIEMLKNNRPEFMLPPKSKSLGIAALGFNHSMRNMTVQHTKPEINVSQEKRERPSELAQASIMTFGARDDLPKKSESV